MFFKLDALKIFENFTGKHLCWSLFLVILLKRDSHTGVSCKICKIVKNNFFTDHLRWLLLIILLVGFSHIFALKNHAFEMLLSRGD